MNRARTFWFTNFLADLYTIEVYMLPGFEVESSTILSYATSSKDRWIVCP